MGKLFYVNWLWPNSFSCTELRYLSRWASWSTSHSALSLTCGQFRCRQSRKFNKFHGFCPGW